MTEIIELSARLSERDFRIIETIDLLGFVTAGQIERLHLCSVSVNSRGRIRRRIMTRLINGRAVVAVVRHKGGPQRWSGQQIYALDLAGERLMRQRQGISGTYRPPRRSLPALQLLDHMLDVSELYVRLVEASRTGGFRVSEFATEPASWWHPAGGVVIKPDAYAKLSARGYADHWWIEVDRGTESVPTVVGQLDTYARFARRGEPGPSGLIPRVLVTVPTQARSVALSRALSDLPAMPDRRLITITTYDAAVGLLTAQVDASDETTPPTTPIGIKKGHNT